MRTPTGLVLAGLIGVLCLAGPAKADIIVTTIMAIQDTSSALNDTLQATVDTVIVEGVVTGADTRASGFGFYIEDPAGILYRGIQVFTGGANTYADSGLARGDRVEVWGTVTEFGGGTEIISLTGGAFGVPPIVNFLGTEAIPGPTIVPTSEVVFNGLLSEQYEGMFIRMQDPVRVATNATTDPRIFGTIWLGVTAAIVDPTDTLMVEQGILANPAVTAPDTGKTVVFLQGIFEQRSLGYTLSIRDGFDILDDTPPALVDAVAMSNDSIFVIYDRPMDPVTTQDLSKYTRSGGAPIDAAILQPDSQSVHLATTTQPQVSPNPESISVSGVVSKGGGTMVGTQLQSFIGGLTPISELQNPGFGLEYTGPGGSDTTQFFQQTLTVKGVVVARFGSLVWIQDAAGGLRSGFQLFAPAGPMTVGDEVTVAGFAIEFFDQTEFSGTNWERNHGQVTLPTPMLVTDLSTFNDTIPVGMNPAREDYEAILVEIRDVVVKKQYGSTESNEFLAAPILGDSVPLTPDTVRVDNRGFFSWGTDLPALGDAYASIVGAFEVTTAGSMRGRVQPRDSLDFTLGSFVDVGSGLVLRLALSPPSPNPVSFSHGEANISFTLPQKGQATVRLYDLRGRLVSTLADGKVMAAGSHVLRWNGTDNGGSRVRSGIYFVQLRLGNEVATGKLVVAE
jgi:hypothetical protein